MPRSTSRAAKHSPRGTFAALRLPVLGGIALASLILLPRTVQADIMVRLETGPWIILGDWAQDDPAQLRCTAHSDGAGPTLSLQDRGAGQAPMLSTDALWAAEGDSAVIAVDGQPFEVAITADGWGGHSIDPAGALWQAMQDGRWIDLTPDWEGGVFRLTDLPVLAEGLALCRAAAAGLEQSLPGVPLLGEGCPDPASLSRQEGGWTFYQVVNASPEPILLYELTGSAEPLYHGAVKDRLRLDGAMGDVLVATDMAGRCLSEPKVVPVLAAPASGGEGDAGPELVFP